MLKAILAGIFAMLFLSTLQLNAAEIYKWTDENGRVHYSDKKPHNQASENVKPSVGNSMEAVEGKNVTMYATSWCGYCRKARRFFNQHSIAFTEYDIEKDSQAKRRYDDMGAQGVPVIIINGERLNGFDEERLLSLVK